MSSSKAQIIVVGNEKGGSGKSTTAIHLTVGLLRAGLSVASIDLDARQGTLTRFFELRRNFANSNDLHLLHPNHETGGSEQAVTASNSVEDQKQTETLIRNLASRYDVLVIDTPGSADPRSQVAHVYADTLVTPINDSFVDLDVLATVNPQTIEVDRTSHYTETVWQHRKTRASHGLSPMTWIVMRNRLSSLDAVSKREVGRLLRDMSERFGFRLVDGFGERVIYRELFLKGLTILDIQEDTVGKGGLSLSHVSARQEIRTLVEVVRQRSPVLKSPT